MVLMRAVILKIYYMPNGLTSQKHKKITRFSGMLGEDEKWSKKKILKQFLRATEQIVRKLLPGSGETDCR